MTSILSDTPTVPPMANMTLTLSSSTLFRLTTKPTSRLSLTIRAKASTATAMTSISTKTKVVPAVIVGAERVGKALNDMGNGADLLVKRGEPVPLDFEGPIMNGMLEPWLENKGLGDANQVLAYFAVSKLGEPPVDGIINTNPEGLTASYGKWASAVADRLHAGGLTCKVLGKEAFQKQMLEKLIWISAFMLVGARHPGATVSGVEKDTALRFPASLQSLPLQQLLRSDWYLKEPWRIDYVRTHELLPTFLMQSKSLNREMVGSIPSLKGQLQKESLIPVPYIRHGSKN